MNKVLNNNPLKLFDDWFVLARKSEQHDATAMALATATREGKPSVRIVLLKAFDERGFVFYTNLQSRKAKELLENPQAALCCYWPMLDKQVRIEGKVEIVTDEEANNYFATRARGSQISAWASKQSAEVKDPEELFTRVKEYEKKYSDQNIPRPEFWSGFRLIPEMMEFWQRGDHRLHERFCFYKTANGWGKKFLYP